MRQAGRYQPEYRALRAKVSFLELCKTPELAAEVTVSAATSLGVDAAILFADILLILEPMGFHLEFAKGEGPVIHNPVRSHADLVRVGRLEAIDPLAFVGDTVRLARQSLPAELALIGFAGAPFTLACYAIEGGGSRHYDAVRAFMYREPAAWHELMEKLVDSTAVYLNAQIDAGAQVVQLFDSWVGVLSPSTYERFVLPFMRTLFQKLRPGIPTIHFGTGTSPFLELIREAGGQVIGLDWHVDLATAWDRLGSDVAVQGNLDPAILLAPPEVLRQVARGVLRSVAGKPGHIFNLGHGVLPQTPPDHVKHLIDEVNLASVRH
jgi:uroporphyrinogen decarboxylase